MFYKAPQLPSCLEEIRYCFKVRFKPLIHFNQFVPHPQKRFSAIVQPYTYFY